MSAITHVTVAVRQANGVIAYTHLTPDEADRFALAIIQDAAHARGPHPRQDASAAGFKFAEAG